MASSSLIEVFEHPGVSYRPLVDFEKWRVALMNYAPGLVCSNVGYLQKHLYTDEVFILLKGRCVLFAADGDETPGDIQACVMQPLKLYNVKKGVWHNHGFWPETTVAIIENSDTSDDNSPFAKLTDAQKEYFKTYELRNV